MSNDIGLMGMGPMGQNLALNLERNGFNVGIFNRTFSKARDFAGVHAGKNLHVYKEVGDFVAALKKPRIAILLVAAPALDAAAEELCKHLQAGDTLIDSGNSFYKDTETRVKAYYDRHQIHFVGMGISGGELGALWGPAMMVGGDEEMVRRHIFPILEKICANPISASAGSRVTQSNAAGAEKCIAYCGPGGAGHLVKMIHNGCEYGIMELIAEVCFVMRAFMHRDNEQVAQFFEDLAVAENVYLFENIAAVLRKRDAGAEGQAEAPPCKYLVDAVKDVASQKGTGKWVSVEAFEHGVMTNIIDVSVQIRSFSGSEARAQARRFAEHPAEHGPADAAQVSFTEDDLRSALMLAIALDFDQSAHFIHAVSERMQYKTNLSDAIKSWRGGCIIRMKMLLVLAEHFEKHPGESLLADAAVRRDYLAPTAVASFRDVAAGMLRAGVPAPAFGAALSYLNLLESGALPTNYIQGMRDCFGAHTFERVDKPGTFHADWLN